MLPPSIDHDIQFLIDFYRELNDDRYLQTYLLNLKRYLQRLDKNIYFEDQNYIKNIIDSIHNFVIVLKNLTSSPKEIEEAMALIVKAANPPGKNIKKEVLQNIALFVGGVLLGALLGFLLGAVVACLLSGMLALAGMFAVSSLMTEVLCGGSILGAIVTGVPFFELMFRNIEQLVLRSQIQDITQIIFGTKEPSVTFFSHKSHLVAEVKHYQKELAINKGY